MQSGNKFLSARWENLAMINFEVDPSILLPFVPKYTELDLFNGKALVSVVGFLFKQVQVFGIKWPYHTNFEEVNLRLYVKHFDGTDYRRGVVFISEIVPRFLIATLANLLYHEQYSYTQMKHSIQQTPAAVVASYKWKQGKKWNDISVEANSTLIDIKKESEEEFIFEHYWGYNQYNATTTLEYGVEHERWQVYPVKSWSLDCDVAALYGHAFVAPLAEKPSSVFLAKGSGVIIKKPRFIRSGA